MTERDQVTQRPVARLTPFPLKTADAAAEVLASKECGMCWFSVKWKADALR
jgi:hypothetical protein